MNMERYQQFENFESQMSDVMIILNNYLEHEKQRNRGPNDFDNAVVLIMDRLHEHRSKTCLNDPDDVKWVVEVVSRFDSITFVEFIKLSRETRQVTRESVLKLYKHILELTNLDEIKAKYLLNNSS